MICDGDCNYLEGTVEELKEIAELRVKGSAYDRKVSAALLERI
jgi:hypothetical protein